ncbi:MAG: tryptophan synthase subunit alpha [Chitinivibrionales bacterium]|nr:tryptophan synthase subunit alpha [Chitinivibrionales bacterium]
MNRYARTFSELEKKGEKAFIPFATAGDPDIAISESVFKTYIDAGADILEIGFPFSDPIADGPVNQRAATRAIHAGLTHASFFALIKKLRNYTDIPIGILIYANSVHHQGYNTFCKNAANAGIDSLLIADMPPEEQGILSEQVKNHGLATVHIVSELTPARRIKRICKEIDAFVYVVSRLGPTGDSATLAGNVAGTLSRLKKVTDLPLCVGFGLSTPDHVKAVCEAGAEGAIIGSALVRVIEKFQSNKPLLLKKLGTMVKQCKKATIK